MTDRSYIDKIYIEHSIPVNGLHDFQSQKQRFHAKSYAYDYQQDFLSQPTPLCTSNYVYEHNI